MISDQQVLITRHEQLGPGIYWLAVELTRPLDDFVPGQFAMLETKKTLLRRAFSFLRYARLQAEFLYKVVGPGTRSLAELVVGDRIAMLAPLGQGLSWPQGFERIVMVAGGVGIVPMLLVAQNFLARERVLIYGAQTSQELVLVKDFKAASVTCTFATDDGGHGHKGKVTDLLPQTLTVQEAKTFVFTCGPQAMMAAVARICAEHKVPCWVSLEEPMACGFGVCLGCVVKTRDRGYICSCTAGPVMPAENLLWDHHA